MRKNGAPQGPRSKIAALTARRNRLRKKSLSDDAEADAAWTQRMTPSGFGSRPAQQGSPNMVLTEERAEEINQRLMPGYSEGDLIGRDDRVWGGGFCAELGRP